MVASVSIYIETIKDVRAKREAAHQYVRAADRFREMARDERAAGRNRSARELDEIAATLTRNASYEVTS